MKEGYYEDFVVGEKIRPKVGRTVTETDCIWFSLLTNNANQVHFNAHYIEKSFPEYSGRLLANGFFTLAVVTGLLTTETSAQGVMLALENVSFEKPVFVGDTIYAEGEVIEKRESRSKSGMGIVKIKSRGYNQKGETLVQFVRVFLAKKR
ncbi:dehydratase [Candidatus Marsarchaeota G2 archaeon ECH_B_SAG-F08]|uniref:Dehydratase n=1 Tax=Candidatus Marsarchaeota G2 archaeon ECH_B_SAG-F08 TaxID=1978165 RepID=A0A2R6BLU1_9ARCH|nr:MAG: dehydratase [Candidatus Marsarchaeota G2 archaeon ECH_B_SAG-F08]